MNLFRVAQLNRSTVAHHTTSPVGELVSDTAPASDWQAALYDFIVDQVNRVRKWLRLVERGKEYKTTWNEISVDRGAMASTLTEHCNQFMKQTGDWPAAMLVGRDEWRGLRGEIQLPLVYDASFRFRVVSRYGLMEYRGVRVILIPWMSGMLAIHDIAKELEPA